MKACAILSNGYEYIGTISNFILYLKIPFATVQTAPSIRQDLSSLN